MVKKSLPAVWRPQEVNALRAPEHERGVSHCPTRWRVVRVLQVPGAGPTPEAATIEYAAIFPWRKSLKPGTEFYRQQLWIVPKSGKIRSQIK